MQVHKLNCWGKNETLNSGQMQPSVWQSYCDSFCTQGTDLEVNAVHDKSQFIRHFQPSIPILAFTHNKTKIAYFGLASWAIFFKVSDMLVQPQNSA
jgi:hypothetical protein